ncbi:MULTISPECIES: autotransporter outer membrane beta-barrel domain-containing protein [unclassified Achromobacter]|uniref:autotransporter outer membrane beta-barrel domain-containing protein n=1 Tax=unclassified Achromobacter TaxID=2626865 RepID=UPI000B51BAE6|nr:MULTISPECIES: autotransporter outer membrane beta-barrel domain-containing protein [unclassified Achromobacter]OWT70204.1 hypothetical protein CEY05_26505 [Achromobacter sp. HZ34]OWT71744.1 hypothetical protein CEY04_25340 [Achromobacter sp. HZ28]
MEIGQAAQDRKAFTQRLLWAALFGATSLAAGPAYSQIACQVQNQQNGFSNPQYVCSNAPGTANTTTPIAVTAPVQSPNPLFTQVTNWDGLTFALTPSSSTALSVSSAGGSPQGLEVWTGANGGIKLTGQMSLNNEVFGIWAQQAASDGGNGSPTATGITITSNGQISMQAPNAPVVGGAAIWAADMGGNANALGYGGSGGTSSNITINNNGAITAKLTGSQGFAGIQALSAGGAGISTGRGGSAGQVEVTSGSSTVVDWTWQNTGGSNSGVYGILAASQGGAGGVSTTGMNGANGGAGGNGQQAIVTLTKFGDVNVNVQGTPPSAGTPLPTAAVAAISTGGAGGAATVGNGNSGGNGGNTSGVQIFDVDAFITSNGDNMPGLLAYTKGGAGGDGGTGFVNAGANPNENGGLGGSTGGATINVTAQTRSMSISTASGGAGSSPAIAAVQQGGAGGFGGFSQTSIGGSSSGGVGGAGGSGGSINILVQGQGANTVALDTNAASSPGIYASSKGGAGNYGGSAETGALGPSTGGAGGAGGAGGNIDISLIQTNITTNQSNSPGIVVDSEGAAGSTGGFANGTTAAAGNGGAGGASGNITITTDANTSITTGNGAIASSGILAQSLSGAGGASQSSNGTFGGAAATAGAGGDVGTMSITNGGAITTFGPASRGILAQAMAGAGGSGSSSWSIVHDAGGAGGNAGQAGTINVTNNGAITTAGDSSAGVLIQAFGGGGGAGGGASGVIANVGGGGGDASAGGNINFVNNGTIITAGAGAIGVLGQSTGGNGGDGGGATGITVSVGGNGGTGGGSTSPNAGAITANLNFLSQVFTFGDFAHAVVMQSIGGGGGNGGNATTTGANLSVSVGGTGASAGSGGPVNVNLYGSDILTEGNKSVGLVAQSIGGGGGTGGGAQGASIGPGIDVSVAVGGQGGSGANGGGPVQVTMVGGSITTGQAADLIGPSNGPAQICPGTSNGACNVSPVDSFGVLVQSIGGGGGHGGNAAASAMAIVAPGTPGSVSTSVSVGGKGGSGGDGGLASFAMSGGAPGAWPAPTTITTLGNGATGVMVQSIGGGGGDGGDSSAMSASVGYGSGASPGGESYGLQLQTTVGGNGGKAGNGNTVQVVIGGTVTAAGAITQDTNGSSTTSITTYGDFAAGIKAQSIGGGGGDAGTGSGNTQDFGTGTTSTVGFTVGSSGSPGGAGGNVTVALLPGNGITTWGAGSPGVIAQSIGGGGGTSQGGGLNLAQSGAGIKPGLTLVLGNRPSDVGGNGGSVSVNVVAPITTHGNDSTGVLAQSIGGGGGLGGGSTSDSSGDNPVLQALQGREFLSDVANQMGASDDPVTTNAVLRVDVGGAGGTGGNGGAVSVYLPWKIFTLGNPVTAGGNQQASSGDWAHGIVAQSIGGGGGKGGTAFSSAKGADWAEYNDSYNEAVGGTGGSGGNGGAVNIYLQENGAVQTVGYGATAIVAQSIGGGGGMAGDGSDALGGELSVGVATNRAAGASGSGGVVNINTSGATASVITTSGTFADGINAQSIGGGGGIAGAGSSIWGSPTGNPVSHATTQGMVFSAGGGALSTGLGGAVYINALNTPIMIDVSGFGAYGILAQSIGGGGGNVIANQAGAGAPTLYLGGQAEGLPNGGPVAVALASGSIINARGTAGIGVLAQSVGGGGGIIRVNDGLNTTPSLTTGSNAALALQPVPNLGSGDSVNVTSWGTIAANGAGGIGIFAQSVGDGGGLILNGSTLYAGSPYPCSQVFCSEVAATGGSVNVTINSGSVSATGQNGIGIFAQVAGWGPLIPFGNPNVIVGDGDPSNQVTVTGGPGGAGVWVDLPGGYSGVGVDQATVKVQEGGVINTSQGSQGTAINVSGGGSIVVTNLGGIQGNLNLNTLGTLISDTGSWFSPGPITQIGGEPQVRGTLLNGGTWTPGPSANANIYNEGFIQYDDAAMVTKVNGHFIQSSSGRLSPMIDSLNNHASLFQVSATAVVDGLIVPNAVSLLQGEVPVLTSGTLTSTAQAKDSLVFDWDARTSGNTITLKPTSFTPNIGALNGSQSSLANYYSRGWNNIDRGLATTFAGLSHIDDVGTYKNTLNNLSSKGTQAQSMAVIESAGTILGAGMSCPVFVGDSVQLGENNCVWGQINGRWTDQSSTSDIHGYHVSSTTYRIGAQHQVAPNWFVGGSLAAGQSYARAKGGSSGDGDVYDGSLTVKHLMGPWYFAGSLAMATGSFNNNRQVNVFGESTSLGSDSNIFLAGGRFRAGYEFDRGDWYIRPYGDVDVVYTHAPGFKESGSSPYALNVRSADQTNLAFSPMLEFGRRGDLDSKTTIRAYAAFGMSWRPDNTRTVRSSFSGADSANGTFNDYIKSPEVLGKVDLGVQLFRAGGYEFRAGYTADIGHSYLSQSATARFAYHF